MAVAALVLGIIAVAFCWLSIFYSCAFIMIIVGIAALTLGIIHLVKKEEEKKGKGLSIAGIITGGIGLLISLILFFAISLPAHKILKGAAKEFTNWAENYDWSSYTSNYDLDY